MENIKECVRNQISKLKTVYSIEELEELKTKHNLNPIDEVVSMMKWSIVESLSNEKISSNVFDKKDIISTIKEMKIEPICEMDESKTEMVIQLKENK